MKDTNRKQVFRACALALSSVLLLVGCNRNNPLEPESRPEGSGSSGGPVTVGSADFPESQAIAEVYAGALEAAGVVVNRKLSIGSREAYLQGLKDGSIDLIPEYTGNLLVFLDPKTSTKDSGEVLKQLRSLAHRQNLDVLEPASAENRDALVVTKATAAKYKLNTVEDLGAVCKELSLAAAPEFATRSYGLAGLKQVYGCEPKKFVPITGEPLIVKALISDDVQIADIFTTSPQVGDNGLITLQDSKNMLLPQQVIPLYAQSKLSDSGKKVLNDISGKLKTEDLVKFNRDLQGDQKLSPEEVAQAWLKDKGLARS